MKQVWSQLRGLGSYPDVATVDVKTALKKKKRELFLVRIGSCGNAELAAEICQLWSAMVKPIDRPVGEPVGLDIFI